MLSQSAAFLLSARRRSPGITRTLPTHEPMQMTLKFVQTCQCRASSLETDDGGASDSLRRTHALGTKRECSCDGVVSESGRLLGLSSVRALKVGAHFAVIPHPNGSCHILLPTHGWRTSQSQEEKRKLHRQIPSCLSARLCLRTRVNLRLAQKKGGNDCYFLSREPNMLTLIQCAKSKGPQKPEPVGDPSVENRRGQ